MNAETCIICTFSISVTFKESGNVSELRDAVLSVATLSLQLLQTVQELPTGQTGINTAQLLVNIHPLNTKTPHQHIIVLYSPPCIYIYNLCSQFSPCGYFLCCILHNGQRVPPETNRMNLLKNIWMMFSALWRWLCFRLTVCIWRQAQKWKPVFFCILGHCSPAKRDATQIPINRLFFLFFVVFFVYLLINMT